MSRSSIIHRPQGGLAVALIGVAALFFCTTAAAEGDSLEGLSRLHAQLLKARARLVPDIARLEQETGRLRELAATTEAALVRGRQEGFPVALANRAYPSEGTLRRQLDLLRNALAARGELLGRMRAESDLLATRADALEWRLQVLRAAP